MKKPKIQTVCGYGCGSSLMLRMNVETIAKQHNVEIEQGMIPSQSDTRQPACPYFPVFSEELWGTRKNLLRTLKYPHHLDFCGKLLSLVPSRLRLHILSCTAS